MLYAQGGTFSSFEKQDTVLVQTQDTVAVHKEGIAVAQQEHVDVVIGPVGPHGAHVKHKTQFMFERKMLLLFRI